MPSLFTKSAVLIMMMIIVILEVTSNCKYNAVSRCWAVKYHLRNRGELIYTFLQTLLPFLFIGLINSRRDKGLQGSCKITSEQKGQFEETQHEHDVSANVLLLTYQKKVNSYKERKNNSYNTVKLPKGHCKTKWKKTMKMKPLTKCWG